MELIADAFADEQNSHSGAVDRVKLMNVTDKSKLKFDKSGSLAESTANVGDKGYLKHWVKEIKVQVMYYISWSYVVTLYMCVNDQEGVPGVLDIFRVHGTLARKQSWRRHMFQIKDGFLKYSKRNQVSSVYAIQLYCTCMHAYVYAFALSLYNMV